MDRETSTWQPGLRKDVLRRVDFFLLHHATNASGSGFAHRFDEISDAFAAFLNSRNHTPSELGMVFRFMAYAGGPPLARDFIRKYVADRLSLGALIPAVLTKRLLSKYYNNPEHNVLGWIIPNIANTIDRLILNAVVDELVVINPAAPIRVLVLLSIPDNSPENWRFDLLGSALRNQAARDALRHLEAALLMVGSAAQGRKQILLSWLALELLGRGAKPSDQALTASWLAIGHRIRLVSAASEESLPVVRTDPGTNATPVFPVYPANGTMCVGWSVAFGLREKHRSPFEDSLLHECEHGEVFGDGTIFVRLGSSWVFFDGNESTLRRGPWISDSFSLRYRARELGRVASRLAFNVDPGSGEVRHGKFFLASSVNFRGNFGHFIYQLLPNISAYLGSAGEKTQLCIFGNEQPFHRGYLEILGIGPQDVLYIDAGTILCGSLSFFRESFGPQVNIARVRALREAVKEKLATDVSPHGDRIYLSRRGQAFRHIVNEEAFEAFLKSVGFDIVIPDGRPAREQIAILERAKVVISPHGSALTNMIFVQSSTTIVEGHSKSSPDRTTFLYELGHTVYWSQMLKTVLADGSVAFRWDIDGMAQLLYELGLRNGRAT